MDVYSPACHLCSEKKKEEELQGKVKGNKMKDIRNRRSPPEHHRALYGLAHFESLEAAVFKATFWTSKREYKCPCLSIANFHREDR